MKAFEFLNHASIKINYKGYSIVTDPWYISNAFGGWYQCPSPSNDDIWQLINTKEELGIVVSHGHDDHCDDWFIKHHLKERRFFCSKFDSPGLERRLNNSLGVNTTAIGEGVEFGPFYIKQFVNPDFTEYDAVITIQTADFVVIHANDNWHKWPSKMCDAVYEVIKQYKEENIFFLIQYGIADCFPINYPSLSASEGKLIIKERFESYFSATQANLIGLKLKHIYYYANQSRFNYPQNYLDGDSLYELAQEYLREKQSKAIQLMPSMSVGLGHKVVHDNTNSQSLFEFCLSSLERFINKTYLEEVGEERFIALKLLTNSANVDPNVICYVADIETWNRIFTAELNLEAIIIGGKGLIYRPNFNISHHHSFISKKSYLIQNLIKRDGLCFFQSH
ncbi:MBL fold metallo-hydrolase [Alteromonas gracilis]|uniref:MBL fold metallo-hydrolase n=1 Tax=Alteromonas gracilis TaxID=1479524 RepID=UPI0030D01755